ncbi:hypothetical protein [Microbacterium aurantiacum]|uniref:hypothetical protein n=1 Tax=Microbacterium aurantiacum TaxID=162393 RepID=UPI000C80AE9F|nr:hypothetical protein [Microbacterium aurantiacum]
MSETTAPGNMTPPWWRRLVLNFLTWGFVLLAAATALTLGTGNLDILQFLLMIVGGWCFGFAFVNATMRMPRNGVVLHIAVAVALGALMVFVTEYGGVLIEPLPEAARGIFVVLQMAAIPATGWIWLGLLGRVTDALTRRERKNAPIRVAPEWERDERGDGSFVRFLAVELRMQHLTVAIAGIVVVVGALSVVLLIALNDIVLSLGPRILIVVIGLVLGLPAYLVLTAVLRRRTEQCAIAFGNDEIRIDVGGAESVIRFSDLEHLRWRGRSDYARVEVRGAGVDVSLFTGIAKAPAGWTVELPRLPRRVFRRFELAGLVMEKSARGEVITFRRPVGTLPDEKYPGKRPLRQETP